MTEEAVDRLAGGVRRVIAVEQRYPAAHSAEHQRRGQPGGAAADNRDLKPPLRSRTDHGSKLCRSRDARLGPIGGGTDEVMKEILGKQYGL